MLYGSSLYRSLYAFAASALVGALATDVAYWQTADFVWVDMSDWLVSVGAVVGLLALIVGIFEILAAPRVARPGWGFGLLSFVAWVIAVFNALVHTRDGWTSVVPLGLILSAVTALLLLFAARSLRARPASYATAEFPA